jgi:hypothetical protein
MTDTKSTLTLTLTDVTPTVDAYVSMWNEHDPGRRASLIAAAWTEDGYYADTVGEGVGREGIDAMVAGVQSHFPEHRIELTSGIDLHHDAVRFGWRLAGPDGTVLVDGIDVGQLAADGRLVRITGFFGDVAPPPAE